MQSEVQQLMADKDAYEKKEIDFEKQSSDLRVQVIELRETKVCTFNTNCSGQI